MIPSVGAAVFEHGEVGRSGYVIDLGEEHATVVQQYRGRIYYHRLTYASLDEAKADGQLVNVRSVRGMLKALILDEARAGKPAHDFARRQLLGVLAQMGYPA